MARTTEQGNREGHRGDEGRTSTAKKVRRKRPRINIHSCSTLFERLVYPWIEQVHERVSTFFLSLSLSLLPCTFCLDSSWKFEMPRPAFYFLSFLLAWLLLLRSDPPPPPPAARSILFLQPGACLLVPRTGPFRSQAIRAPIFGAVSNGYSKKLFQIEG